MPSEVISIFVLCHNSRVLPITCSTRSITARSLLRSRCVFGKITRPGFCRGGNRRSSRKSVSYVRRIRSSLLAAAKTFSSGWPCNPSSEMSVAFQPESRSSFVTRGPTLSSTRNFARFRRSALIAASSCFEIGKDFQATASSQIFLAPLIDSWISNRVEFRPRALSVPPLRIAWQTKALQAGPRST